RDTGCELSGLPPQHRRYLSWDALMVAVSDPDTAKAALVGWQVDPGTLPANVVLPYDVTTATTVAQALKTLPHAKGEWVSTVQFYSITTADAPKMSWLGGDAKGGGTVDHITNMLELCD